MAAMKLYMTPGSCSTGIHIILEELEEVFEAHVVNLPSRRTRVGMVDFGLIAT
jgi:glutathione S-transferase